MNKLYFRAWLKDEKRMVKVCQIEEMGLPHCSVGFYRGDTLNGEFFKYRDFDRKSINEVILMQGIEIDGQVVYEGDIVKAKLYDDGYWEEGEFPINDIFELQELWRIDEWEVIGNIYENK